MSMLTFWPRASSCVSQPKMGFSGRIENDDAGLPIDENNRVLRGFDQRAEGMVCSADSSAVGELVKSSLHVF